MIHVFYLIVLLQRNQFNSIHYLFSCGVYHASYPCVHHRMNQNQRKKSQIHFHRASWTSSYPSCLFCPSFLSCDNLPCQNDVVEEERDIA